MPSDAFFWSGEKVQNILHGLRDDILLNQGFLVITGQAGSGKTTLARALIRELQNQVKAHLLSEPCIDPIDFYNTIAMGYGLDRTFTSKVQFLLYFGQFLHNTESEGRKTLLVIDNCQQLSQNILEELRSLVSIRKSDGSNLINILLIGRQSFLDVLKQPKNLIIEQQIMTRLVLAPLDLQETQQYIMHRLKCAGAQISIFNDEACAEILSITGGSPTKINSLCNQSLIIGDGLNKKIIDKAVVCHAATEIKTLPQAVQPLRPSINLSPKSGSRIITKKQSKRISDSQMVEYRQKLATLLRSFAKKRWSKVLLGLLFAVMIYTVFNVSQDVSDNNSLIVPTPNPQEQIASPFGTDIKKTDESGRITVALSPLKIINEHKQRSESFWQAHQDDPRLTKVDHKDLKHFIVQLNQFSGLILLLKDMTTDLLGSPEQQILMTKRLDDLEKRLQDGGLQSAQIFRLSADQNDYSAEIAEATQTPESQVVELIVIGDDLWWGTLKAYK
jgi:type II secretory pathway predicted ATPase ExeA